MYEISLKNRMSKILIYLEEVEKVERLNRPELAGELTIIYDILKHIGAVMPESLCKIIEKHLSCVYETQEEKVAYINGMHKGFRFVDTVRLCTA